MLSPASRWALVVVFVALGLAASGALLVDYSHASPVFCSEGAGCDVLRQTPYAHPAGVPLPVVGIFAFAVMGLCALGRGFAVRMANVAVAGVGGLLGLGLLGLQLLLGHFCSYCAVADTAAVLLAVFAVDRSRNEWDRPDGWLAPSLATVGLILVLSAPLAWGRHAPERLPTVIAEELAKTPPGQVTLVDFVDFECPFCRRMQTQVAAAVEAQKGRVRLVRKNVPLTRIHPHALAAAKAACCGEALGKGDAMADALFATKVEDLTPEGCEHVAESVGLPLDRYRDCIASPETDARLARDRQAFDHAASKGDGLPLMWIGTTKLMGAQEEGTVDKVLAQALSRRGS